MVDRSDAPAAPERHLGVFDAVCVVVGIVVGSFIFFLGPYLVAQNTTSPATMFLSSRPTERRVPNRESQAPSPNPDPRDFASEGSLSLWIAISGRVGRRR